MQAEDAATAAVAPAAAASRRRQLRQERASQDIPQVHASGDVCRSQQEWALAFAAEAGRASLTWRERHMRDIVHVPGKTLQQLWRSRRLHDANHVLRTIGEEALAPVDAAAVLVVQIAGCGDGEHVCARTWWRRVEPQLRGK